MTPLTIRPGRTTDAGRVGEILSGFIDDTPWMPRIHTRAEDLGFAGMLIDKGWVEVAETAAGVVGFIARQADEVHALYVAAPQQGQGVGSTLLKAAFAQSDSLSLWTFQANHRAQAFYLNHGFVEVDRTDGAGNDEGLPDIRYTWQAKDKE